MYLARKFGDICMVWFGNGPVVIVHIAKAAYDLFHGVSTRLRKAYWQSRRADVAERGTHCFMTRAE